jgi:hypothetical protein
LKEAKSSYGLILCEAKPCQLVDRLVIAVFDVIPTAEVFWHLVVSLELFLIYLGADLAIHSVMVTEYL